MLKLRFSLKSYTNFNPYGSFSKKVKLSLYGKVKLNMFVAEISSEVSDGKDALRQIFLMLHNLFGICDKSRFNNINEMFF